MGCSFQPSNTHKSNRKRSYSAHHPGYPSRAGPNPEIRVATRVRKINSKKTANKNLIAINGTLEDNTTISATKEIILAAGTIQSSGLLELSGIGRENVLRAANIQKLVDLPGVGENFQDRLRIQSSYRRSPTTPREIFSNSTPHLRNSSWEPLMQISEPCTTMLAAATLF
ncbi:hypothetical protein ETB97_004329 [Aspergillus alliaceus]|uniref:glucose oxidase n=1 Tax=Petromyces alliaceus TaxID=209559 RepID=A0A8H5ZX07_PETAA|nr:hypothetical protein ETB97_004329 [Aspergillus burnettii]